jgi:hypothetical protein
VLAYNLGETRGGGWRCRTDTQINYIDGTCTCGRAPRTVEEKRGQEFPAAFFFYLNFGC